ncbi:unnamed protein product [Boreogadus saida]
MNWRKEKVMERGYEGGSTGRERESGLGLEGGEGRGVKYKNIGPHLSNERRTENVRKMDTHLHTTVVLLTSAGVTGVYYWWYGGLPAELGTPDSRSELSFNLSENTEYYPLSNISKITAADTEADSSQQASPEQRQNLGECPSIEVCPSIVACLSIVGGVSIHRVRIYQ